MQIGFTLSHSHRVLARRVLSNERDQKTLAMETEQTKIIPPKIGLVF